MAYFAMRGDLFLDSPRQRNSGLPRTAYGVRLKKIENLKDKS